MFYYLFRHIGEVYFWLILVFSNDFLDQAAAVSIIINDILWLNMIIYKGTFSLIQMEYLSPI